MTVGFSSRGAPASVSSLTSVVRSAQPGLHEDWLQSLREGDGGRPDSNEFAVGDDNPSGIAEYLSLQETRRHLALLEDDLGGAFLPIAYDVVGDYVRLGIGEGHLGVCFWDHETGRIEVLTDTFTAFLESLQPFDSDSGELKPGQVISGWIDPGFLAAERKKK